MPKKPAKSPKSPIKVAVIHFCSACALGLVLTLTTININTYLNKPKVLGAQIDTIKLQEEREFLENLVAKHPTYRDGWLELAKVSYKLGDASLSRGAIETARAIDPNSPKIEEVENLLFR